MTPMQVLRSLLIPTTRLALALALGASATAAVAGAQEARFSGSVEMNNVTVEVEVTRRGKPVTGLRKEDFQVLEDGQEREITNFAWMGGGAAVEGTTTAGGTSPSPTAAREPHVVLLFDVNGLERPRLVRAVEAARQWVDRHAGQGILWSVAVVGTRPVVLAPFTADLEKIRVALDAGTSLSLALLTAPPGATQVLPIVVRTNLEKMERFYPWTTNLFGGNSLEVRPGGRFLPGEELVFFFVVINPPRPAGAPPATDVKVAVLRDGQPVARGQWLDEDLSMMAPRTFLFGSSFPLAALDGEGPHSLRFRVEIHGSEVARTLTLPLLVGNP